jgi:hypothetical protein
MRQLQIRNGFACAEWQGNGTPPTPPDNSWLFLDVTNRPNAQVGMAYDIDTDTFSDIVPPPRRKLTRHEFLSRFTIPEEVALEMVAASTDPASAQTAAGIRVFQRRLLAAMEIDLDHPEVIAGLNSCKAILRSLGVWATDEIADQRIAEILASVTV